MASKQRTQAQNQFAEVPGSEIPRTVFNRSHGLKTTFDSGQLIPIFLDDVLPGDTMNMSVTTYARMATLLKPVMDNMFLEVFWFFVPHRLVWDNWRRFMGEQDNPADTTDYEIPECVVPGTLGNWTASSLGDYLGLPTGIATPPRASALPFRSVALIWNEWFRDENLQDSWVFPMDDGPDDGDLYTIDPPFTSGFLPRRGKRHDYFSSSLPFPQKGPVAEIPSGQFTIIPGLDPRPTFTTPNTGGNATFLETGAGATGSIDYDFGAGSPNNDDPIEWEHTGLVASFTASNINALRTAFAIQHLYERDARGGSRYVELVKSHFGVTMPASQWRTEFLGHSSQRININPVAANTVDPTHNQDLGDLSAYATTSHQGRGWTKSFVEHGYVIGLASVRAEISYQYGLDRHWSRVDRADFYFPSLANLGEQPVYNKEIYVDGSAADEDIWGYIPRFDEYRFRPSKITGIFRSQYAGTLDVWHLGLEFTSRPLLNEVFIEDHPPIDRIVAVTAEPEFLFDAYFSYKCARPMPAFAVPGLSRL